MAARTFELHRTEDVSGVSGIADGVEFPDDVVVIRWRGEHASTVIWPDLPSALAAYGHDGRTTVVWDET